MILHFHNEAFIEKKWGLLVGMRLKYEWKETVLEMEEPKAKKTSL